MTNIGVDNGIVTIEGMVVDGDKRGRLLGFPTANIVLSQELPVEDGVWASTVQVEGKNYAAATSIGGRPTFYGTDGIRLMEVHLLDFVGNLYGQQLTVLLHRMLRPQRGFDGSAELIRQIHQDLDDVRRWARASGANRVGGMPQTAPKPSREHALKVRRWRRELRLAAAAALAERQGKLTHAVVADLAAVPVGLLKWSHPDESDLLNLARSATKAPPGDCPSTGR